MSKFVHNDLIVDFGRKNDKTMSMAKKNNVRKNIQGLYNQIAFYILINLIAYVVTGKKYFREYVDDSYWKLVEYCKDKRVGKKSWFFKDLFIVIHQYVEFAICQCDINLRQIYRDKDIDKVIKILDYSSEFFFSRNKSITARQLNKVKKRLIKNDPFSLNKKMKK